MLLRIMRRLKMLGLISDMQNGGVFPATGIICPGL